jgi:hypothetical protein
MFSQKKIRQSQTIDMAYFMQNKYKFEFIDQTREGVCLATLAVKEEIIRNRANPADSLRYE